MSLEVGYEGGLEGIVNTVDAEAAALLGNRRMLVIFLTVLDRGVGFFKDICAKDRDRALKYVENGTVKPLSHHTCRKRITTLKDKMMVIASVPYPGYAGRTAYEVTYKGREIAGRMRILLARMFLKDRVGRLEDGFVSVRSSVFRETARDKLGVDPDLVIRALSLVEENGVVRIPVRSEEERPAFNM